MTSKIPLTPLFFLVLFIAIITFISPVLGQNGTEYKEINLTHIPIALADQMNIDLFPAQLFCSSVFMMIVIMPVSIIARSKRASFIPEVAISLIVMGFLIGIGWLPYWFLIILSVLIALMFAGKMRDVITGAGGK